MKPKASSKKEFDFKRFYNNHFTLSHNFLKGAVRMKSIVRMVMLSAVMSVCLMGCGGDDSGSNPGSGNSTDGVGSIVGDWLLMESTVLGDTTIFDDGSVLRSVQSYKSSGEYSLLVFTKNGGVWSETNAFAALGARCTWRTVDSTLNVTHVFEGGREARITYTYLVSNDNLTTTITSSTNNGIEDPYGVGATYTCKKIDLASYRRSLGL
jgi:hypothetical protein